MKLFNGDCSELDKVLFEKGKERLGE